MALTLVDRSARAAGVAELARVHARGKFLWAGDEKLYLRGVTYGTFRPDADGIDFPPPSQVERDLAAIAEHGFNAVRTYTVPPRQLLDIAARHGLRVMVGLPWEQHVAFLDDEERCRSIEQRVREGVRKCGDHPALLAFAVGNEIPASIVRWHGRKRIERFLERLGAAAREEAPDALITYVNFPSTEYLDLTFVDFYCFNVYLEKRQTLESYLKRLQTLAGDRPLVLAEVGLDSRRNGLDVQAASLAWQLRSTFRAGAAGAFVFAWTDEWHRGGHDVEDWDFGLVDREREPKPALAAVEREVAAAPGGVEVDWPRISVAVCSRNGERTIRRCLESLAELDYPDYEVIVVNDGSTDSTPTIAEQFDVRVLTTGGLGLSGARNVALEAADGDIIAYLDDDAYADAQWLKYLAIAFADTDHAAIGGPNLAPADDGVVANCIACAPGGPVQVLLSDDVAEHTPGCNLAFRREILLELGGFDEQFRIAGDDVDVCWRAQDAGHTVGYHAAALVWHHRRDTVRGYWRQQREYGRAEAMLESKWPERYNAAGHVSWSGRIYGPGGARPLFRRWRVYYGTWGTGAFQTRHEASARGLAALPLMPEWYLIVAVLAAATAMGALWRPMLVAAPLLLAAVGVVVAHAVSGAARARFPSPPRRPLARARLRTLTASLYLLQGLARLRGRIAHGLAPWGRRAKVAFSLPRQVKRVVWSEEWRPTEEWLSDVEGRIRRQGARTTRRGVFDRWDLAVRGGGLGGAKLRLAVEEHGQGRQQLLFQIKPTSNRAGLAAIAAVGALGVLALVDSASVVGIALLLVALALVLAAAGEAAAAVKLAADALERERVDVEGDPLLKANRPRISFRRRLALLRYVWPNKRAVITVLVTMLAATGLSIAGPWPMKVLIDNVLGHKQPPAWLHTLGNAIPGPGGARNLLILVVAATVLIFLFNALADMLASVAVVRLGQAVTYALAADVFAHLQRLSIVFHSRRPVGDTMARVNADSFGINGLLNGVAMPVIHSLTTLISMFVIMWALAPSLTLLALAVVPLQLLVIVAFGRPMHDRSRERLDQEGRMLSVVERTLTAIPIVQAFTRERIEQQQFIHHADRTIRAYMRETLAGVWFKLFAGIATVLGTAMIMYLGATQAFEGHVTAGTIIVFLTYLAGLYGPLDSVAYTVSGYQAAAAQADRVIEILDTKLDVEDRPGAREIPIERGHVRYESVGYGYDASREILHSVSLEAHPGETIAVVGPTGAGKSTLMNLLVRFIDPQRGRIAIDGHDVRSFTIESLRSQIAMVMQDPFIMPTTVAGNIAYGRPDATREEIEEAAKAANAHDFISRLASGYDSVIGERGTTLSGGEKQRLSIARAFLKDAPILVLDEPTSALDARTEAALLEALRRLSRTRTSFIIAHRLSTIRDADRIVVLEAGEVVEQGTHEELVRADGLYARMYNQQVNTMRDDEMARRMRRFSHEGEDRIELKTPDEALSTMDDGHDNGGANGNDVALG